MATQAKRSSRRVSKAAARTRSRAAKGATSGNGVPRAHVSKDQMLKFYRDMLLIRRFEEKAGQLYGMGLIGGFCHLYIGQEAVVVGVQSTLGEDDYVITTYRDHGHMLACGMDAKGVMAELTGRRSGYSKGKGGSMHMFSKEKNFFGGHGIVGAPVPIGAGLALSQQYLDTGGVTTAYFGDGASNQGQVHEALNMSALWKLPVIYVIENNKYGMGTSVDRASAAKELYRLGEPVGIPGHQVDGMDVLAVRAAAEEATAHARSGKGPIILEMMTYRYRGHSMSDPAKYRSREEVAKMREQRDAIDHLRKDLLDGGHAKDEDLKAIDNEVKAIVTEAAEFAQNSPEPDPSELYTDVYAAA
jgi:pyruvate dehydrogenase E1 component alpha subunit